MRAFKRRIIEFLKPLIEKSPGIATALRKRRDNNRIASPVRTPLGFLLQGNSAMQSGNFEPCETAVLRTLLRDSDVLINVGANIGYYCCLALQDGKSVVAFEPVVGNLHHLLSNLRHNGWDHAAEVYPIALADRPGVVNIYGGGTGASLVKGWANVSERYVTLVPVNTAERVLGSRFEGKRCVILVDIEGSEGRFLAGASNLLKLDPAPVWLMEITIHDHLPRGVTINPNLISTFDRFFDEGYSAWTVGSEIRMVSRDEVLEVAETGRDSLKTHNFLFARDARILEVLRSSVA